MILDIFFNMAVIFLNGLAFILYLLIGFAFVLGPLFVGFFWFFMLNTIIDERPRLRKRSKLWFTLSGVWAVVVVVFLYSLIFTTLPTEFWQTPFFPGDVWLGGFR